MNANDTRDYRNTYGAIELNGLENGQEYHDQYGDAREVYWTEPGLRVTRLRLITDPGFPVWDVSYCHGRIGDEPVRVELPFSQLPRRGMRRAIVEAAKADKVYATGLGILDPTVISTLV
jgi:hypothetical protein